VVLNFNFTCSAVVKGVTSACINRSIEFASKCNMRQHPIDIDDAALYSFAFTLCAFIWRNEESAAGVLDTA
jgi:hypothetical protein